MCDYREQLRWKGQLAANISAKLGDIVLLKRQLLFIYSKFIPFKNQAPLDPINLKIILYKFNAID